MFLIKNPELLDKKWVHGAIYSEQGTVFICSKQAFIKRERI